MTAKLQVIYILGRGRSGSTFLERRAAQAIGATMLGEVRLWPACYRDDHICGCHEPKTRCPFWSAAIDALPDRQAAEQAFRKTVRRGFLLTLALGRSATERLFPGVQAAVVAFYRHLGTTSGRRRFIDSSKNPAYALLLDRADDIELRLIHVVRHPLGVVYSWKRQRQRSQEVTLYRQRKPLVLAALEWSASNALAGLVKMRARHPALTIRYEDIGTSRTKELLSDLADPAATSDPGVDDLDHVMSGNPGAASKSDAFAADNEWQTGLKLWEKVVYGALTYPVYVFVRPTK